MDVHLASKRINASKDKHQSKEAGGGAFGWGGGEEGRTSELGAEEVSLSKVFGREERESSIFLLLIIFNIVCWLLIINS